MRGRLYQRALSLLALALAASACSTGPASEPSGAVPPSSTPAADVLLAGLRHELVDAAGAGPALLADEIGADRHATLRFDSPRGAPATLLPPGTSRSHGLALSADGSRALIEAWNGRSLTLWLEEPAGAWMRLRDFGGRERVLPAPANATAVLTLLRRDDGSEALVETSWSSGSRSLVYEPAPEERIEALDAAGRLLVLRRSLPSGGDELVLLDRSTGLETPLPAGEQQGRDRILGFDAAKRGTLLIASGDGEGDARLESLALADGSRRAIDLPCAPVALRTGRTAGRVVLTSCTGARRAVQLGADGRLEPEPDLPRGTRLVDWLPLARGAVIETAGPSWPADLAWVDDLGETRPLTYGLSARIDPAALPLPAALTVDGPPAFEAELWESGRTPRSLLVWLQSPGEPRRWLEHAPLPAALTSAGTALLRMRTSAAADDANAVAALRAARATLLRRFPGAASVALLAEGPEASRVALAAVTERPSEWSALAVVGPALSAPPELSASALSPTRAPVGAAPAALPAGPPEVGLLRVPTLLLLDPLAPSSRAVVEWAAGASAAGVPVRAEVEDALAMDPGAAWSVADRLFRFLTSAAEDTR